MRTYLNSGTASQSASSKYSGDFAKAKANRIYLENFLKSKRSILMSKSSAKSVAAAEVDAYADPEYIGLLEGLKEAVECEEKIKWMLTLHYKHQRNFQYMLQDFQHCNLDLKSTMPLMAKRWA